ncbi:hypothetical protein N9N03_00165 [Chlamydiia bacterium]|nr:hypothetical protein [Chlamydiia bacterium]
MHISIPFHAATTNVTFSILTTFTCEILQISILQTVAAVTFTYLIHKAYKMQNRLIVVPIVQISLGQLVLIKLVVSILSINMFNVALCAACLYMNYKITRDVRNLINMEIPDIPELVHVHS